MVANDRARYLLRTGDGLLDRGGFLFASTTHDNDDLQRLLNRALPLFGALGAGGSMLVSRSGSLPPLALHINPVGPREADSRMWPVAALALVVDPAGKLGIDPDVAAASLSLTRMEGRVAVLLAGGMNVREITAATRRRESTVRSHVKHIFAKRGLSRQADLVRLVRSLVRSRET